MVGLVDVHWGLTDLDFDPWISMFQSRRFS